MASRRGFLRLSRVLPTSRVFTSGYVNAETILHFFILLLLLLVVLLFWSGSLEVIQLLINLDMTISIQWSKVTIIIRLTNKRKAITYSKWAFIILDFRTCFSWRYHCAEKGSRYMDHREPSEHHLECLRPGGWLASDNRDYKSIIQSKW